MLLSNINVRARAFLTCINIAEIFVLFSKFFAETLAGMKKSSYLCSRKRGSDTPVFRGSRLRSLRAWGVAPLETFFERLANKTK